MMSSEREQIETLSEMLVNSYQARRELQVQINGLEATLTALRQGIAQLPHYYSPQNDRDDHVLLDDVLALLDQILTPTGSPEGR